MPILSRLPESQLALDATKQVKRVTCALIYRSTLFPHGRAPQKGHLSPHHVRTNLSHGHLLLSNAMAGPDVQRYNAARPVQPMHS